jgi:hypothetical protein
MMKYKYNGTDERVFPSIGKTVKPGDEFDAPEGFTHPDCTISDGKTAPDKGAVGFKPNAKDGDKDGFVQDGTPFERPATNTKTMSAASDRKLGDE